MYGVYAVECRGQGVGCGCRAYGMALIVYELGVGCRL